MRNTKLILAMLAGCTLVSGAALAQDASSKAAPTPASTSATPMHTGSDSMKSDDAGAMKGSENGSMKSTHKKTHKSMKTDTTAPAKSSTAGGM